MKYHLSVQFNTFSHSLYEHLIVLSRPVVINNREALESFSKASFLSEAVYHFGISRSRWDRGKRGHQRQETGVELYKEQRLICWDATGWDGYCGEEPRERKRLPIKKILKGNVRMVPLETRMLIEVLAR